MTISVSVCIYDGDGEELAERTVDIECNADDWRGDFQDVADALAINDAKEEIEHFGGTVEDVTPLDPAI